MQGDKDKENTKAGELKTGVLLMVPFFYLRRHYKENNEAGRKFASSRRTIRLLSQGDVLILEQNVGTKERAD
jgi:hypothetical protein